MGELTKLSYTNREKYLKTSVPTFVVNQFELKAGDYFDWLLVVDKGEIAIKLVPRKSQ
jgi:hypothetical protein